MEDPAFETQFNKYSDDRKGKEFWKSDLFKSDLFLKIEHDIERGNWTQVANADNTPESKGYKIYSSTFDEHMNLPDNMQINEFKEWFNGRIGKRWGDETPSKIMFKNEVIDKFPTFAILVSKHAQIKGLINNFKTKHPEDFLSLKKSYMLDMLRDDLKDYDDRMRSAYSKIVSNTVGPDEGFRSAPITDAQRQRINKMFFKTHVY